MNNAQLTGENHCGAWPMEFLSRESYQVIEGWRFVGSGTAPWKSGTGETKAIVFEKCTPATESYDEHDLFEPGLYWCHGNSDMMNIQNR